MKTDLVPELLGDPAFVRHCSESFVEDIKEYIRPTHIIKLLLLLKWSPENSCKIDKFEYLQKLAFTYFHWGIPLTIGEGGWSTLDIEFTTDLLEDDVVEDLYRLEYSVLDKKLVKEIVDGRDPPWEEVDEDFVHDKCLDLWDHCRKNRMCGCDSYIRDQVPFRDETPLELF